MSVRRLTLSREGLTSLHADELQSIAGAISSPHPLCELVTSLRYSYCPDLSCGIGCSARCPTDDC